MKPVKTLLSEQDMPKQWYNIQADLPTPLAPPYHPATMQIVTPEQMNVIFPMSLIEQEMSDKRWWEIPDEVLQILALWRPTPLQRAYNLEKALGTPAKIYFKNESVSPAGSHKPNTSVPQAYYNKKEGIKRIATETGAGQWGSAMSLATNMFGIECTVYMVRVSYDQKPYRKSMINTWGAEIFASPSTQTESGRKILAEDPDSPGSLGLAISEAVEDAAGRADTNYALGSVLNHVCMHQTIIGEEALRQFKAIGEKPDVVIGCIGGGSNFAGIAFPFLREKMAGMDVRVLAIEPASCPTVTKGVYAYDYGDMAHMAPIVMMHTLGHTFMPPSIHAGGLRYHGMAPTVSRVVEDGLVEARAITQLECFESGVLFARTEGIIPAPESTHAIRGAVEEALIAKEEGKEKTILFNLSGHGHFDMSSYDAYFAGKLHNYRYPQELVDEALKHLPKVG
ncbi:pyridoxal-phosphate dependent TrpB-like enzyme [Desulfarculus baarsii DSM 2075]|uniref:Tryptophan synthase beta chain n=1 Tax=Desulfarculus baarsii (strain ATCC 33931 / DSM 2075 / LMG 7858 / VKM B-1802 / 2st14) TaxID=644282 RepID=E1QDP0_DESB2|nr:TrpB-like pyridoxal phosphate-dependent enzyme [Desulfarculus baarsii]ADK83676.1 pyridoxal-phosphate dependent TrpB-like enzyme [Desulfarculus baarsii DSM 2075]